MILFPEAFVQVLILGALLLTTLGAVLLVGLFIRDRKNRQVW